MSERSEHQNILRWVHQGEQGGREGELQRQGAWDTAQTSLQSQETPWLRLHMHPLWPQQSCLRDQHMIWLNSAIGTVKGGIWAACNRIKTIPKESCFLNIWKIVLFSLCFTDHLWVDIVFLKLFLSCLLSTPCSDEKSVQILAVCCAYVFSLWKTVEFLFILEVLKITGHGSFFILISISVCLLYKDVSFFS